MATVSKEQEQAIKRYLRNPDNYIEYQGVKIVDNTEFSKFVAKLFNLPDNVSDKPGMNKVGYLKKQNAELFDGYEIRKGNIFKRDKPLIQALKNDPVFRDEVNKKLKALKKKDFFDLTKDQQNTIVGTTEKVKRDLKVLPKNFLTRNDLAERLKLSIPTLEAYQGGKLGETGDKFREVFKPIVLKNRGTFFDSTNLDNKLKKFNEFRDRPILHNVSKERASLYASNPEIQKLLNNRDKSLFQSEDGLKIALKAIGKGSTPHEAASAMTILARAYNGEKFKGLEIKPNKPKAKFIFKNFSELGMDNPWTMSLYDEGLRQVDRDLKNKVGTFAKFKKDYTYEMNKLLKDLGIKKKFNINEITSVKASYNNKVAPYAAFVDITQADVNQKTLANYQGDLSRAMNYLDRNKDNQAKVLAKIERFNEVTRGKRAKELVSKFGEDAKDVRLAEIIAGTDVESVYGKGDLDRWKSQGLDLQKLADEKGYFLDVKGARPFFDITKDDLKKSVQGLIKDTEDLPKNKQVLVCNFLSNGGLPGDCKRAISQDPEKAAQIISKIPADTKETAAVKDSAQKLVRLYRGEEPARKTELYKDTKGMPGMYDESLKGRFFFDNPADARYYAQRQGTLTGNVKSVDVPEKMVNIGKKMADRRRGPNYSSEVILPKKFVGQEKINIPQTAFARAEAVVDKMKWDNVVGAFTTKDGDIATQADIKTYAAENPMEIKVGEEPIKAATNKSVLANVGKAMARIGAPLPTALLDSYFIGQQVKEGKGTAEIASNPLNWLGLATMEPLTKVSGVATGSGVLNKALRLGLNPATIRGISRFAGLPGLAISTAMTAYDQYQKYKDGEGFIFNLLNQKGTE